MDKQDILTTTSSSNASSGAKSQDSCARDRPLNCDDLSHQTENYCEEDRHCPKPSPLAYTDSPSRLRDPINIGDREELDSVSDDTSELLPSENAGKGHYCSNFSTNTGYVCQHHVTTARLRFHIRLLYTLIVCLAATFVCFGVVCIMNLQDLRHDLDLVKDNVRNKLVLSRPDSDAGKRLDVADSNRFSGNSVGINVGDLSHWDVMEQMKGMARGQSPSQPQGERFWEAVSAEEETSAPGELPERWTRVGGKGGKERAKRATSDGPPDDWAWMSTFVRVPISVLKAYCQQAKTYCNAEGPRGLPGPKGTKGDKGDTADGVRNMAYPRRGPPGPKGERGHPGTPGQRGRAGEPGRSGKDGIMGAPGEKGERGDRGFPGPIGVRGPPAVKGDRGERGVKGERGADGRPATPGAKGKDGRRGPQGPRGHMGIKGPKGDPGFCKAHQCVEIEPPTEAPVVETTTPAPTLPPRARDCSINIIGKPVFLSETRGVFQGSWMQDSDPGSAKVWATYGTEGTRVWEFATLDNFKNNKSGTAKSLSGSPYIGTGHKVYKGFMYYQWKGQPKIVRFDLRRSETRSARPLPDLADTSTAELRNRAYLYSSKTSFVDFHVDSNGLWALYVRNSTGKMVASYLDMETLDVKVTVPLDDLAPGSKGGAFIACGLVYTVRHHNRHRSHIDGAHDLWRGGERAAMRTAFSIPYGRNSMMSYNSRLRQILAWDADKQLTYPLLLNN